jgi:hypothetical protein
MSDYPESTSRGFRLVDLLVLFNIGWIVVLVALQLLHKAHKPVLNHQCIHNLKQICLAVQDYTDTWGKPLPPLSGAPIRQGVPRPQSILFAILPFIEQDNVYKEAMEEQTGHTWAATLSRGPLFSRAAMKLYYCPMDSTNSTTLPTANGWMGSSYAANAQVFGSQPRVVADPRPGGKSWNELVSDFTIGNILDGTSNTIFFCERLALAGPRGAATPCAWANPPAGGAALGNTDKDALGCPLQTFVSRHGSIRASVGGPGIFFGCGTPEDPVGAVAGDNAAAPMYPLPEIGVNPLAAATDGRAQSQHAEFIYVGMGDGSVRHLSVHLSQVSWARAISPDDGLPLGGNW